jgi:hypothetical protein
MQERERERETDQFAFAEAEFFHWYSKAPIYKIFCNVTLHFSYLKLLIHILDFHKLCKEMSDGAFTFLWDSY